MRKIRPSDLDAPFFCKARKKWIVREALYPESRGYIAHEFPNEETAQVFSVTGAVFVGVEPKKKPDFKPLEFDRVASKFRTLAVMALDIALMLDSENGLSVEGLKAKGHSDVDIILHGSKAYRVACDIYSGPRKAA